MSFAFVAHLKCPLCTWSSLASAQTYAEAEHRVSAQLMEHLGSAHPRPASDPRARIAAAGTAR